MGEIGQVIEVSKDKITVRLERQEACAKCRACSVGLSKKEMLINAKNNCSAQINDWVNIELSGNAFITAVYIMYGIPFLFLITGFVLGYYISGLTVMGSFSELIGFITGLIFMCIAFVIIKLNEYRFKNKNFLPVATEVTKTSLSL